MLDSGATNQSFLGMNTGSHNLESCLSVLSPWSMSQLVWAPGKRPLVLPTLVLSARTNDPSSCRLLGKAGCDNVTLDLDGSVFSTKTKLLNNDLKLGLFPILGLLQGSGRERKSVQTGRRGDRAGSTGWPRNSGVRRMAFPRRQALGRPGERPPQGSKLSS